MQTLGVVGGQGGCTVMSVMHMLGPVTGGQMVAGEQVCHPVGPIGQPC
jgi:hypothetical protein